MMVHYHIVDTAFGYATVAFCGNPFRLVEVGLPRHNRLHLCRTLDRRAWQIDDQHPRATALGTTLIDYFNGQPIDIPWPVMDFSRFTPAQQAVFRTVASIPYGGTAAYGEVAQMAGLPRAARFVGTTMANNPYPVLIPCHRVIQSNGSPGRFGGGQALKRSMLELEAASMASRSNASPVTSV